MPSLLDIADLCETAGVGPSSKRITVQVHGLSARDLVPLLQQFPELRQQLAGREVTITPDRLLEIMPTAAVHIIACSIRQPHEIAEAIGLGDQADILSKCWDLTFARGLQNFLDALEKLAGNVVGASGWAPVTNLPGQSSSASPAATTQPKPGDTPHAS